MSSHITQHGHGLKDLLKAVKKVSVTVGVHEADGSAAKEGGSAGDTVADAATNAELGIGQPPRRFITGWFDEQEQQLKSDLEKIAAAAVKQRRPVEQAMQRFGAYCVGQVQQRMADGIPPELSPARKAEKIALSGSAKDVPLIFTGQLRSSVRSVVEVGK